MGGAFSPGIEMTWISRNPAIYHQHDPFRINAALRLNGPLSLGFHPAAMEPGDVTRYMAVPWQADFNECSSQPMDGGRYLWWWPAQRPEHVYLEAEIAAAPRPDAPAACVEPRPVAPVAWVGTDFDQMRADYVSFADDTQMVHYWSGLGFVLEKEVAGKPCYVEVARTLPRPFTPE